MYINFTKYTFDECIRRLFGELSNYNHLNSDEPINNDIPPLDSSTPINSNHETQGKPHSHCSSWTHQQVIEWATQKNINSLILEALQPCDGRILTQLKRMLDNAPEFFYQAIATKVVVSLREIAIFTYELDKLFR
jgi:hypothetical protein